MIVLYVIHEQALKNPPNVLVCLSPHASLLQPLTNIAHVADVFLWSPLPHLIWQRWMAVHDETLVFSSVLILQPSASSCCCSSTSFSILLFSFTVPCVRAQDSTEGNVTQVFYSFEAWRHSREDFHCEVSNSAHLVPKSISLVYIWESSSIEPGRPPSVTFPKQTPSSMTHCDETTSCFIDKAKYSAVLLKTEMRSNMAACL